MIFVPDGRRWPTSEPADPEPLTAVASLLEWERARSPARVNARGSLLLHASPTPCFDCWEEHPGHVHTSSLAAVAAGLRDVGGMLGHAGAARAAQEKVETITGPEHTLGDAFVRFPGDTRVDGSLLWLAVPFGLVDVTDSTFTNTPMTSAVFCRHTWLA